MCRLCAPCKHSTYNELSMNMHLKNIYLCSIQSNNWSICVYISSTPWCLCGIEKGTFQASSWVSAGGLAQSICHSGRCSLTFLQPLLGLCTMFPSILLLHFANLQTSMSPTHTVTSSSLSANDSTPTVRESTSRPLVTSTPQTSHCHAQSLTSHPTVGAFLCYS